MIELKDIKVVMISDTHGWHRKFVIPECDLLIHSGDITYSGELEILTDLNHWFGEQPAKEIVVIPGNHDLTLDPDHDWSQGFPKLDGKSFFTNANYLQDTGFTTKDNFLVWGSGSTLYHGGWAFNRRLGEIDKYWDMIPDSTDILVTHGPPEGILSEVCSVGHVGCSYLKGTIFNRLNNLKLHAFGHIHENPGMLLKGSKYFVNASMLDRLYRNPRTLITFFLNWLEGRDISNSKDRLKDFFSSAISSVSMQEDVYLEVSLLAYQNLVELKGGVISDISIPLKVNLTLPGDTLRFFFTRMN